jgi:hypothetical protein
VELPRSGGVRAGRAYGLTDLTAAFTAAPTAASMTRVALVESASCFNEPTLADWVLSVEKSSWRFIPYFSSVVPLLADDRREPEFRPWHIEGRVNQTSRVSMLISRFASSVIVRSRGVPANGKTCVMTWLTY